MLKPILLFAPPVSVRRLVLAMVVIALTVWITSAYEQDQRDALRRQEWCAAYSVTSGCVEYPDDGTGR